MVGDNSVATRTVVGLSGTSVTVVLVALVITIPGTCSTFIVIFTAAAPAVAVSGVAPKVTLLPISGAAFMWVFLLGSKSLSAAIRLHFGDGWNYGLSRSRYSSFEDSSLYLS